jgi:hypothetical protein
MKFIATLTIEIQITAKTPGEALEEAKRLRERLAGSNTGSEMLADAPITITSKPAHD